MIAKFLTAKFGVLLAVIFVVWVVTYLAIRYYWKGAGEKTLRSDYLKVPINNTLSVMGIVCPLLIALASYLYVNIPSSDYSFVLASICVFVLTLIVAIWETFCLLNKATNTDDIKLLWSRDSAILTGMGILYSSLILGVVYLVLFFLLDLSIAPAMQAQAHSPAGIALTKAIPQIGETRLDVLSALGAPTRSVSADTIEYQGTGLDLEIQFDTKDTVQKITEQKH
jgi:hypothetical protein